MDSRESPGMDTNEGRGVVVGSPDFVKKFSEFFFAGRRNQPPLTTWRSIIPVYFS
jgi:hypothetical protein